MIKIITTLLFFTLLFTACAERGSTLKLNINTSLAKPISKDHGTSQSKSKIKSEKREIKQSVAEMKSSISSKLVIVSEKKKIIPIPSLEVEKTSSDTKDFFTLSDETKNKISGFFVIIIGILILI